MTRISISDNHICAEGHAGYAEQGKDIVCAGISTLMFTLAHELERRDIPTDAYFNGETCSIDIKAQPDRGKEDECELIFETITEGLFMIAETQPQYVQLKWEV